MSGLVKGVIRLIQIILAVICVIVLWRVAGFLFKILAAAVLVILALWLISQFVKRRD